jgi:hypothetical protein
MLASLTPPLSGGSGTFSVATWNIRSARGSGLAAAAKGLRQMGVGCCVLTETKLTDDRYSRATSGYRVILSTAASPQQGEVTLLWEEGHQDFEVEAVTIVSPNLLTFQLVTGEERYFVMGAYIPPDDTRGWMTSAPPGLPAPPTVNRCCWETSTLISEPRERSGRRSSRTFLTKSTLSTRCASSFRAKADDRDLGHGGLGGSGGGDGGTTPSWIILWPGRWTRRHFGVWAFDSRGSMTRTIEPSSSVFRGDGG